jgi:hypothetical protein
VVAQAQHSSHVCSRGLCAVGKEPAGDEGAFWSASAPHHHRRWASCASGTMECVLVGLWLRSGLLCGASRLPWRPFLCGACWQLWGFVCGVQEEGALFGFVPRLWCGVFERGFWLAPAFPSSARSTLARGLCWQRCMPESHARCGCCPARGICTHTAPPAMVACFVCVVFCVQLVFEHAPNGCGALVGFQVCGRLWTVCIWLVRHKGLQACVRARLEVYDLLLGTACSGRGFVCYVLLQTTNVGVGWFWGRSLCSSTHPRPAGVARCGVWLLCVHLVAATGLTGGLSAMPKHLRLQRPAVTSLLQHPRLVATPHIWEAPSSDH